MLVTTPPLADWLKGTPYVSYTYAYPHKTVYRKLETPIALHELWATQQVEALFLYLHIPFCEMRCGFCNLFTTANPQLDIVTAYLDTLERQAKLVRNAVPGAKFARFALGGGTPTFLTSPELERVLNMAENLYGIDLQAIPASVETSPGTAELEKLKLLRERGIDRISIGVQSFGETEVHAVGRAQKTKEVETALNRIKSLDFPTLNIDLIYGLPEQSVASWLTSLQRALEFTPQELYLYPLYKRPLTGIDRKNIEWAEDKRLECYRAGRTLLLEVGYEQVSMRMFRLKANQAAKDGPLYCCQEDGMVGLGCGARSYTQALHYSSEYAVSAPSVKAILADYVARPDQDFEQANFGVWLDQTEQRRRYIIQSLLQNEGLSIEAYKLRFGSNIWQDLPALAELLEFGLVIQDQAWLKPTPAGLEHSDMLGPWLYSQTVNHLMESYELR
jgi:oxygen-independent coproporphyrinogen-3 oxidase